MPSAQQSLEAENHQRDADFNKALHGSSAQAKGGITAMLTKNREAKKVAVDEYFKHFDNKEAKTETKEDREVCFPPQTLRRSPRVGVANVRWCSTFIAGPFLSYLCCCYRPVSN